MAEASRSLNSSHGVSEFPTPAHRQPYQRQSSGNSQYSNYQHVRIDDNNSDEDDDLGVRRASYGLGLSEVRSSSNSPMVKRVPVGSRESISGVISTPTHLDSPSADFSQNTTAQNTPGGFLSPKGVSWATPSHNASRSTLSQPFEGPSGDTDYLISHNARSCPTRGDLLRGRWSWFSITVLTLAIYSTAFSAAYLVIAFLKPRWGERIGTQGHLSYSNATLLSALFAKTIELSFATVFVALLGQVLSRRATAANLGNGGISIAEMNMRAWIMQPGTLLTNFMGVRYAMTTILGLIALLAAIAATFYTTAAEALVAPKLKMGPWDQQLLAGRVAATYANSPYLVEKCQTPIQSTEDGSEKPGTSCFQIDSAGQSFHNFKTYLSNWTDVVDRGETVPGATSFQGRPLPVALLYDNTTVHGQWINVGNITKDSRQHDRLVLNVTMAMPHANIFSAVRDPVNHILQPNDLQGNGEYFVEAAVPAPVLNVLCAGISAAEANATFIGNDTNIPPDWPNAGKLTDLFGFTNSTDNPPLFPKLPQPYNTVVNNTKGWGPRSIYLLAAPAVPSGNDEYVLCGLKTKQSADCTTSYHVTISGGQLAVHCGNDTRNTMTYSKYNKPMKDSGRWEPDWTDVAQQWIRSVSLSQGATDGNASIARILTEMIPPYTADTDTVLLTSKPTIGEGLSVLAGATLLMSSEDSPFIDTWNYSETRPYLTEPQLQYFHARLKYSDYASGSSQNWQGLFYIVLLVTFLLNSFALAYLAWNFIVYGQVTDFTEPQNLFALALNSPPSRNMAGACGGGPQGRVLAKKWSVNMQQAPSGNPNEHPHFFAQFQDEKDGFSPQPEQHRNHGTGFASKFQSWREHVSPKFSNNDPFQFQRRKRTPGRPRSIFETDGQQSPAVEQYQRLSKTPRGFDESTTYRGGYE